jgi:hypothetical protein
MGVKEGEYMYSLLKADNTNRFYLQNECYGMPVCDPIPFSMEQQVMLKKINNEEFEVFYYRIGCGTNYTYMRIFIEEGKISRVDHLDSWSESFPC